MEHCRLDAVEPMPPVRQSRGMVWMASPHSSATSAPWWLARESLVRIGERRAAGQLPGVPRCRTRRPRRREGIRLARIECSASQGVRGKGSAQWYRRADTGGSHRPPRPEKWCKSGTKAVAVRAGPGSGA